jgi:hypothetical protein
MLVLAIRPDHRIAERAGRDHGRHHGHSADTSASHWLSIACIHSTLPAAEPARRKIPRNSAVPARFSPAVTP